MMATLSGAPESPTMALPVGVLVLCVTDVISLCTLPR